jgi:hypothetical protein
MKLQGEAMDSFMYWTRKPFNPRRAVRPTRRGAPVVTIRVGGSFARSAAKVLIVLALLAAMTNIVGERTSRDLRATAAASVAGLAGSPR